MIPTKCPDCNVPLETRQTPTLDCQKCGKKYSADAEDYVVPAQHPDRLVKCEGCGRMTDPTTCGCGYPIDHPYMDGHSGIPQGCICHYTTKN